MNGGYIYDDDTLLYQNPAIRRGQGLERRGVGGDFGHFWLPVGADANVAADYAPLADTTLWLEWRFWGNNGDLNGPDVNPAFRNSIGSHGYHTTNIILHGIAALLLWYLLAQIRIPGAWLASLGWAVHPVCAESVAWIAERRNPLSMILFILTMINWFPFPAKSGWRWRLLEGSDRLVRGPDRLVQILDQISAPQLGSNLCPLGSNLCPLGGDG